MGRKARGLLLLAAVLAFAPTVHADDDEPSEKTPLCKCEKRRACWHYLNSSSAPADDPCSCVKCETRGRHAGTRPVPGWNPLCWAAPRLDCLLKRHAASWRLTCSECLENAKCCAFPGAANCPNCAKSDGTDPHAKDPFRKDARTGVAERLAVEKQWFKKTPVIIYSRYFYVVTDIPKIKVRTNSGGTRWMQTHEWAHLMIERAEKAFEEFREEFDGRVQLLRPMGMFFPKSETTARPLQEAYFRARGTHMIYSSYGARSESSISDGFCLNGFCVPLERMKPNAGASRHGGGEDYAMHLAQRHMLGHILFTCWLRRQGDNRSTPRWAFVGAGQWFGKRPEKLRDNVYYCTGEDHKLSGSGKDWWPALVKRAQKDGFAPISELIEKTSLSGLEYPDHVQAWGYFHLGMEEWRDGFRSFLAALRREEDQRESFEKHLGVTPEQFHERFVERLLGKRRRFGPPDGKRVTAENDEVVVKLDRTLDHDELAAQIRRFGAPADADHSLQLLDVIGTAQSDLVRETSAQMLRRAAEGPAREVIASAGLAHTARVARAYAARVCGELRLRSAKPGLRALHEDPFWLARAEAAIASATLQDFDAQARLRAMLSEPSAKVRIGAMDALTLYGEKVNPIGIPPIARNLEHGAWQLRLAAAQTLAVIGDEQAVKPLIDRLEKEAGRVRDAIVIALESISGEEFGGSPGAWKGWWEREAEHIRERGGFTTGVKKPDLERPNRYVDEQPEYYGVDVFSQRVAFVIDTSKSTDRIFRPNKTTLRRLYAKYDEEPVTVNEICRREVEHSIGQLHTAARFNVLSFGSRVQTWNRTLVRASAGNKRSGASFARSQHPSGETNFHGALAAALDLEDHPMQSAALGDTPDTIFFLTDGTPTVGDITDPATMLAWFGSMNRYSRARVHTIAFGTLGVDEPLLRGLAQQNWGTFVQLFESN